VSQTTGDALGLPEVPVVLFERPPLVLTVCQVRFPAVLSVADPVAVAPFQRAIQARYPVAKPLQTGVAVELGIHESSAELRQSSTALRWQFADPDDNWTVVLSQDFVTIETRLYHRFSEFIARLREVLDALLEHIRPSFTTRIGLRYVNEIRAGHQNWSDIVNSYLMGVIGSPDFKGHVSHALQQIGLEYDTEMSINIRHGLLPSGTTVQPRATDPSPDAPFYLLDYDAFREFSPAPDIQQDLVCMQVESFNRAVYRLFRWSITPTYASSLGERPYDAD
jgi:uncharacterized protein (TIGR04255 family)